MATTFEKTWQFSTNFPGDNTSTSTNFKSMAWLHKAFLRGDMMLWATVASGSNGVSLPQSTINVTFGTGISFALWPSSGTFTIQSSAGAQMITYTGITASSFTGCSGGTGTLSTGNFIFINYTGLNGVSLSSYQGLWTTYYSCDGTTAGTAGDGIDRWGAQGNSTGVTGTHGSFITGATIPGAIRFQDTTASAWSSADVGNYLTITGSATAANNTPTNTPFMIVNFVSSTTVDIINPSGVTGDANNGSISWTERNVLPIVTTTTTGVQTLPTATINVTSTTNLPSAGTVFIVTTSAVVQAVTYTGTSGGNQLTGCSGGTGNTSNGGLVTTYGITQATAGTAHSWYVLKSPTALGPYYFTIDVDTTGQNLSFCYSKTAPTGGTTTARPTSPDEVVGSWNNNTSIFPGGNQGRVHGGLATDGNFHILTSQDANGQFYSGLMWQVLADTKTNDLYTAFMYQRGSNTTPLQSNFYGNAGGYSSCRSRNGAVTLPWSGCIWQQNNSSVIVFSSFLTSTDYTDSSYDDLPIYVYVNTAGYKSLRGRFIDYRWAPVSLPQGAIESSQSSPTSIIWGNLWIPYNAVPIL